MVEIASKASNEMRLRFAGQCSGCQAGLAAGVIAIYHRETKSITCLNCAPRHEPAPITALIPMADAEAPAVDAERDGTTSMVVTGTAGASAQREYERRKDKRESRIREAHPVLGGLMLAMSDDPQSTKAWATGARGEELLGARLNRLEGRGVYVLHDRRIPPTKANIDHIAVSPSGVFVIDAKRYTGRPALRVEGGFVRPRTETLVVGSRDCTKIVKGAQKQVDLVTAALASAGFAGVPVRGMLCFVEGDWPLFGGDFSIAGIDVLWPRKAVEHLQKPGSINEASAQNIHRALSVAFPTA